MSVDIEATLKRVPNIRMFQLAKQLDMPPGDVIQDGLAVLILVANEHHRLTTHKDDWHKFLHMPLTELNDFLGINDDEESAGDAEPKSVGHEPAVLGRGLPEAEGPNLSDPQDFSD